MLSLDTRTIMLVWSVLSMLFAGILALVGTQAVNVKGVRQWALADLMIGLGLAITSQMSYPPPPALAVPAAILIGIGLGLIYNGIEAFEGKPCRYWIPALLSVLVLLNTFIFGFLFFDSQIRIIINFVLIGSVHLLCAKALFIRIEQPLRTAYWLAGSSMLLMTLLSLARILGLMLAPANSVSMFAPTGVTPIVLLFASVAQMSMSFAFLLMINFRLAHQLNTLATTDSLTGLLNRRSFEKQAQRELQYSKRTNLPVSLLVIDVDHFKRINDESGHLAGDEVLRQLAQLMTNAVRTNDYIARYGGEEFCILLPNTQSEQAHILAERIRILFSQLDIAWHDKKLTCTVSIGVTDSSAGIEEFESLLSTADQAMYAAKRAGRNRVLIQACTRRGSSTIPQAITP
ncbi:GGDEF domain-containing protein [Undibacterium fentianense]|uniref:diguanylate cyclase n=1 Tax=Undibacterium fentianense TaxID=2828728 RepID=A0A941E3R7_9BURK|nr:GGDEF domain-containing protein [Undibacterium fentianense]MBR7800647.1 GGDEF domain-containing protein [Undibacterium fentianense]